MQTLYQKGSEAYQQSNYQQAQAQWQEGFTWAKKDSEPNKWAAYFLCGLGRIAESTGDHKQAIQFAEQGLKIIDVVTDKTLESEAHVIIGQAYTEMGDYAKAKYHSELARQIAVQIGNLKLVSDSSRTLGAIYKDQGQIDLAQASYQEALALAIKADDKLLQAKALNNLGELFHRLALYEQAFAQYQQSLQLRESLNDLAGQGKVLGNICRTYITQNEYDQGLSYCERALKIARRIHDRAHEANHLNNIAGIFRDTGKYDEAINYSLQSLAIKYELSDLPGEAKTLNNIGDIFRLEKKYPQALGYFSRSLKIKKQLADRSGQSASNFNSGLNYADLGQYNDALSYLNEALLIQTELNEPDLLWRIYSQLSYVHHQLGHQWPAIFFGKHAVNTIQSIRSSNQGQSKQLQQSYLKDKGVVYEQLANLLIDQGRLGEAQKVLNMLKEEEYFDFIRRGSSHDSRATTADYTQKESGYESQYKQLTVRLFELGKEYTELDQKRQSTQTLTPPEQQRLDVLSGDLEEIRKNYRKFVNELEQIFDKGSDIDLTRSLEHISQYQGLLSEFKDNTVLIHYLVNDEKLRILITGKNQSIPPVLREDSISRSELNQLIFAFRKKLLARAPVFKEAKDLYDHLIKPIAADLQLLKPKILMIYPYQSLRYLPFSALYDGNQYLVEQYALALYNAAAETLALKEKPKFQWRVAGFGVSKSPVKDFADLPFVEDEINGIVKGEAPKSTGILPGSRYINQAFTPARLMDTLKEKGAYQVFHLATHFKFSPG
ncbi:MAG: tetratricopeptide repeat protein, partial [Methylococcaceae bacterium]|nr:tetratricopeptide repeat protein [Methylococcaceae bacterium]